ncbi:eyes absent homolog 4-like [Chenopodium quinoa]|uniref:eyes absent homolog 4-like n=1 Tax=Chenopodium quinoa TaxID=63459 RepID=UPI000B77AE8C|nr:eyes absent homolog 4-like [Chenopodium quinoa]
MSDCSKSESALENENHVAESSAVRKKIVYIWDMDETLILLKSLLDGTYAVAFSGVKDVQKGVDIGKMWEKFILDVCDDYFFYEQIEQCNEPVIDALSPYDDGADLSNYDFSQDNIGSPTDDINKRKLAYRHRIIAQKYKQGLHTILDQKKIELWNNLYEITDSYTDGWLSSARTLLQHCSGDRELVTTGCEEFQCINILVTAGSLIPSLVKCLLFKLDSLLTCENIYSAWDVGKLRCFSWIKERFGGPDVQFCVIGDGWEECEAAEFLRWPFVKIDPKPDGHHRFPGLTRETVGHYLAVVYGRPDAETEDQDTTSSTT